MAPELVLARLTPVNAPRRPFSPWTSINQLYITFGHFSDISREIALVARLR